MKVFSEYHDGKLTIFLQGELDHHEVRESMALIDELLDSSLPRECALNLRALSFMDSSGIALILKLRKRMLDSGGSAWVEEPCAQPLRVIDASGIERIVKITAERGAEA